MATKKDVITVEDILRRKDFFKEKDNRTQELYVSSLDADIIIKKPSKELLLESSEMDDDVEANSFLVYECIKTPDLHSPALHEMFKDKIKEPWDIVYEVFDVMEVSDIADMLIDLSGRGGVKSISDSMTEEIKK